MSINGAHRIVQVTDCHQFADPSRELLGIATRPRLEAVLEDLRARSPRVDLLVITGDTAHDEAQATYEAVRESLGDLGSRLRIVPGNHDDRELLRNIFPTSTGGVPGRTGFRDDVSGWQVLGLDTQRPGEVSGELGEAQLDWLEGLLAATPDQRTLLFMHHPPIEVGSRWLDEVGLKDSSALGQVLEAHPQVRAVFCGHVHHEVTGAVAGAAVHTTPAVGPQLRPLADALELSPGPPGYRLIDVYPDGRWTTEVVRCTGPHPDGAGVTPTPSGTA